MVRVKRFFVILISLAVCYLLQMIVFPSVPFLIAVPNMMLIEVVSAGFLYGKAVGLAVGAVSGLLLDILGSGIPGFYTLILSWLGYADGFLSEKMESELIFVLFLLMIVNEVLYHTYVFALAFMIHRSFSFGPYLKEVFFPEVLLTLVCFLVVYGFLIFISKRWDLKVNKGEVRVV